MSTAVGIYNLGKTYPGHPPVDALLDESLEILDNEFFTLLGPSGCGKTTLLRIIAGFEQPTKGRLELFGDDISQLPPEKRPVNTVFQHYSLFPHMSVMDNVAFGLRRLGMTKSEATKIAKNMLDLVHLSDYGDRKASQLSGGQQQRVALARALAPRPKVLLLDEPLSALDLKLRQSMRAELKRLQKETGITFIFVTHDQEEALAMSDRIAVMSQGRIQQVGSSAEIYEHPANRFVAEFIGDANIFDAIVERNDEKGAIFQLNMDQTIRGHYLDGLQTGEKAVILFRPERALLVAGLQENALSGTIKEILYLGGSTDYVVQFGDGSNIIVRAANMKDGTTIADEGEMVSVIVDPDALRVIKPRASLSKNFASIGGSCPRRSSFFVSWSSPLSSSLFIPS